MANEAHGKLRKRGNIVSTGPAPLSNKMLDSLEGYLDNTAVAATQTVAKGGPQAELQIKPRDIIRCSSKTATRNKASV